MHTVDPVQIVCQITTVLTSFKNMEPEAGIGPATYALRVKSGWFSVRFIDDLSQFKSGFGIE